MRVALVHELLTIRGGAEKVMRNIAHMFPDAPVYTLLYDERKLGDWFPPDRIRTSNLQQRASLINFPLSTFHFSLSGFNHHLYLKQFPRAAEAWDFSGFDLVISSSSAFAHGIITNGNPKHLCYVQSPARYLWDRTHDVMDRAGHGPLGPLKRWYLSRTFHRLRVWDTESAQRPDTLLAPSHEVQRRIELYWRRTSDVIPPSIDDVWFDFPKATVQKKDHKFPYYLIVSQLVPYKRIDLAIRACNTTGARLIIAGEGHARKSLEAIAGPTVSFHGYASDAELKELYANARATIFPGDEDFGLVPLESLACGTPVVAYKGGGALETLTAETAEFFDEETPESLAAALERSRVREWKPDACAVHAAKYSRARFEERMHAAIDAVMNR